MNNLSCKEKKRLLNNIVLIGKKGLFHGSVCIIQVQTTMFILCSCYPCHSFSVCFSFLLLSPSPFLAFSLSLLYVCDPMFLVQLTYWSSTSTVTFFSSFGVYGAMFISKTQASELMKEPERYINCISVRRLLYCFSLHLKSSSKAVGYYLSTQPLSSYIAVEKPVVNHSGTGT